MFGGFGRLWGTCCGMATLQKIFLVSYEKYGTPTKQLWNNYFGKKCTLEFAVISSKLTRSSNIANPLDGSLPHIPDLGSNFNCPCCCCNEPISAHSRSSSGPYGTVGSRIRISIQSLVVVTLNGLVFVMTDVVNASSLAVPPEYQQLFFVFYWFIVVLIIINLNYF